MRKKYLIAVFILSSFLVKAQDPVSSQYYFNPLNMNPAFTGANYDARLGLTYRRQWPNIPSKFETSNFWGDITTFNYKWGIGIIASNDVSGEGKLTTNSFSILFSNEWRQTIYSKKSDANKKVGRFRLGGKLTYNDKRIDWSRLVFSDQLDPLSSQISASSIDPGNLSNKKFLDFSVGALLDSKEWHLPRSKNSLRFTLGGTLNHITKPNESLSSQYSELPIRKTVHGSFIFNVKKGRNRKPVFSIAPSIIWEKQAEFKYTNMGFYLMNSENLIFGAYYRKNKILKSENKDALILFIGLRNESIRDNRIIKIGYSYDVTINNDLARYSGGSHEISITMDFTERKLPKLKREAFGGTSCPNFGKPPIYLK